MNQEVKTTLIRMMLRSIIVQPVIIAVITPYYFWVLNFTYDQWVLWLWSSQPINIVGINMTVFGFLELIKKVPKLRASNLI